MFMFTCVRMYVCRKWHGEVGPINSSCSSMRVHDIRVVTRAVGLRSSGLPDKSLRTCLGGPRLRPQSRLPFRRRAKRYVWGVRTGVRCRFIHSLLEHFLLLPFTLDTVYEKLPFILVLRIQEALFCRPQLFRLKQIIQLFVLDTTLRRKKTVYIKLT